MTSTPKRTTESFGLLTLRASLGIMWIAHALLKLLVFTLPGTAKFFDSIGLPGMLAYPTFVFELCGGIAIVLGFYGRQVSLLLIPILVGAAWVHLPNGWVHTSSGGGWEYPVFLIAASVALWLIGDGEFCLKKTRFLTLS
jgi:putative oxidoreductase